MSLAIENNSIKELANISKIAQEMEIKHSWSSVHSIICECNVNTAYSVLKDITLWPQIFEACKTVQIIKCNDNCEEIAVTANGQGQLLSWITCRTYDDKRYTINFTLPKPMPLLKSMQGSWRVIALGEQRCIIYVERYFELLNEVTNIMDNITDKADAYRFILRFSNENADIEMQSLKLFMESREQLLKKVEL